MNNINDPQWYVNCVGLGREMTLIVMAPGWPGDAFMNTVSIGFRDKYLIISVFQKMWYRVASRWIMYMQLYLFHTVHHYSFTNKGVQDRGLIRRWIILEFLLTWCYITLHMLCLPMHVLTWFSPNTNILDLFWCAIRFCQS